MVWKLYNYLGQSTSLSEDLIRFLWFVLALCLVVTHALRFFLVKDWKMSEKKQIGVIAGLVKQTIEQHHAITNIQDPDERRVTEMIGQKVTFQIF